MENINTNLGKNFDVSKLYIGIYESKDGERIGLFKKDSIHSTIDEERSYQFYKDILSDYYVAMSLDSQGNDRRNLNTFEKINLSKPLKNGYFFVKF